MLFLPLQDENECLCIESFGTNLIYLVYCRKRLRTVIAFLFVCVCVRATAKRLILYMRREYILKIEE